MLNLIRLNLCLLADGGKGHGAILRCARENELCEGGEGNLLVQELLVLLEEGVVVKMLLEDGVCLKVSSVEGEEEITQPSVLGGLERIKDGVKEEFTKVVDVVADESGDAQIVGNVLAVVGSDVGKIHTCKVEECGAVV